VLSLLSRYCCGQGVAMHWINPAACSLPSSHVQHACSFSLNAVFTCYLIPQNCVATLPFALQALNQRHRNILAAWQWLQANKTRFRYPVFGPVALEVECPDQQHLQYLEQQVAGACSSDRTANI
jgi:hypothetical protein